MEPFRFNAPKGRYLFLTNSATWSLMEPFPGVFQCPEGLVPLSNQIMFEEEIIQEIEVVSMPRRAGTSF